MKQYQLVDMADPRAAPYSEYVELALKKGANEAKIIKASYIKTAAWIRLRCQFGCTHYGTNLCCPPYAPTPEETQKAIDNYSYALLVRFISLDEVKRHIPEIEREVFIDGRYKSFGFAAGRCRLCPECNLKTCVQARKARPSMEAAGIDVYETVRKNGFTIEVLKNQDVEGSYFGLVLIE
jgi:predicted metal-binding protein